MTQRLRLASFLSVGLVALLFSTSGWTYTRSFEVSGTEDKFCIAYLHDRGASDEAPLVVSFKGTGIYTTAHIRGLDSSLRSLLNERKIRVLTFDKPGISPGAQSRVAVVNDAKYNRYIQDDLVECATQALAALAEQRLHPIIFSGHSEGAQISIRLAAKLAEENSPLNVRIKALYLSGMPLGPWRTMLEHQLKPRSKKVFFEAYDRSNDLQLRKFGNLTTAYLRQAFALEPLEITLDRLAAINLSAKMFVYHGLNDLLTPVTRLVAYQKLNDETKGLNMVTRYYPTGHSLNRDALQDIKNDIISAL